MENGLSPEQKMDSFQQRFNHSVNFEVEVQTREGEKRLVNECVRMCAYVSSNITQMREQSLIAYA